MLSTTMCGIAQVTTIFSLSLLTGIMSVQFSYGERVWGTSALVVCPVGTAWCNSFATTSWRLAGRGGGWRGSTSKKGKPTNPRQARQEIPTHPPPPPIHFLNCLERIPRNVGKYARLKRVESGIFRLYIHWGGGGICIQVRCSFICIVRK
jgi:hypothetical protein